MKIDAESRLKKRIMRRKTNCACAAYVPNYADDVQLCAKLCWRIIASSSWTVSRRSACANLMPRCHATRRFVDDVNYWYLHASIFCSSCASVLSLPNHCHFVLPLCAFLFVCDNDTRWPRNPSHCVWSGRIFKPGCCRSRQTSPLSSWWS